MKPFLVLWTGQALSLLGTQAVQFALIWWLTRETGSATVLAMASLVGLAPPVLLGPFAGALVDRWDRKLVMLVSDASVAAASLVLAVLFFTQSANVGAVFAVLAVRALGATFHSPAMLASTSLMVPERHLTRVQGFNQMLQGGLLIAAAPLGGLLLALLPMGAIMLVDVATAFLAIAPLAFIRVPQPARSAGAAPADGIRGVMAEMAGGLGYLRERPGYLGLVYIAAAVNAFMIPALALLPLLVADRLSGTATELAWISSAFGVGMIAGGIGLGIWGGFKNRVRTSLAGLLGVAAAVLGVGLAPGVGACATAMFTFGALVPFVNGPIHAMLQAGIDPGYQGRVFALMGSLAGIAAPAGLILAAPVAELLGVRAWYVASALACVLTGVAGLRTPALMRASDTAQLREQRPAAPTMPLKQGVP